VPTVSAGYARWFFHNGTDWLGENVEFDPAVLGAPVWTSATLLNSWLDYGGSNPTPGYTKLNGVVYLRGTVKSGTTTAGTTIFTLPAGYRPAYNRNFAVVSNGAFGFVNVAASGDVQINVGSNVYLTLDNISFPAMT
jgi:hypothetical protein